MCRRTEKKYGSLSPGWEVISGPPLTAKVLGSTLSLLARTWGRGVGSCVRWRTALPVAVAVSSSASLLIRLIVPHHGRFKSGGVANQPFCGFYNPDMALVIFLFVCFFSDLRLKPAETDIWHHLCSALEDTWAKTKNPNCSSSTCDLKMLSSFKMTQQAKSEMDLNLRIF